MPDTTPRSSLPDHLVAECLRRGYTIWVSDDGTEERLIRPDGTVAVTARLATGEDVRLSAHDQDHFLRALENPPEPTEALRQIMTPKGGRQRRVENPPHGPTPERIMRHYYGAKR
jgi:hypothetical protein